MAQDSLPTRTLADHPELAVLRREAQELLDAFRSGQPDAVAEVTAHRADAATLELADAQGVLARAYGFETWPALAAYAEGATDRRLVAAVRAGDLALARALVGARPELAGRSGALHVAVIRRDAGIVRVLMEHGANARVGVYPHRDATSPLTMATERGYDDIVAIIRDRERRRQDAEAGRASPVDALFEALQSGDDERAIGLMEGEPSLVGARHPGLGFTPLHVAARTCNAPLAAWLIDRGADVEAVARDMTPLDAAARSPRQARGNEDSGRERFDAVVRALLAAGAELTPLAAAALGDADRLRAAHAAGSLTNPIDETGGLLTVAASHDREEILALLLEFGLDPDERIRCPDLGGDEVVFTWGMPLYHCVRRRRHAMARLLLEHGADPNADMYASGTPVFAAYSGHADEELVRLLERHGGVADPATAGYYRRTDLARRLLADASDRRAVAEELLDAAACGGDPEIVRMALEHVDWPRGDPRWFAVLEQPLRIWNHGSTPWARHDWDRGTYLTCFRLILGRCDPNIRGRADDTPRFGLTLLHGVAGSREHVTAGEREAFAAALLDAGARTDIRDDLLGSTPLGWACRWGRVELVRLLLARGADPVEADAEPWATPEAWARKMNHGAVLDVLRAHSR